MTNPQTRIELDSLESLGLEAPAEDGRVTLLRQIDCREWMEHSQQQGAHPEGGDDLIFADPPFNNGSNYDTWDDNMSEMSYWNFMRDWISLSYHELKESGSLWINVPDKLAAKTVIIAEEAGFHLKNWCIWHYRFGQNTSSGFTPSKTHVLWFVKDLKRYKFFPDAIQVPSDRAAIYNDSRSPTGTRVPFDVWGFEKYWGRVQGNNAERNILVPNQLPEAYLQRVISACTEENDWVYDPFCGSGTTVTVAHAMRRNCYTTDVSRLCISEAHRRVLRGLAR